MKWHLVIVYGPAQPEGKDEFPTKFAQVCNKKDEFLTKFAQVCNKCKGPAVIGGNLNIIRSVDEKNKPCILPRWSHTFNSIIEISGLKEVKLIGRKYIWANNLSEPTSETLDRVLVSLEWYLAFPLTAVRIVIFLIMYH
jgi:hypothetical protein